MEIGLVGLVTLLVTLPVSGAKKEKEKEEEGAKVEVERPFFSFSA